MRMFLRISAVLLTAAFLAVPAWCQGNPCEDPIGSGGGCSLPISVQHGGLGTIGAIDTTGTRFEGGCAFEGESIWQPRG